MRAPLQIRHFAFLAIVYFFLLLGYIFTLGFYSFSSIWILLGVFGLLIVFYFLGLPKEFESNLDGLEKILSFLIIFSIALALYLPKALYETENLLKKTQLLTQQPIVMGNKYRPLRQ